MPWQETRPLDQRLQFVADHQRGLYTMTELCARYAERSGRDPDQEREGDRADRVEQQVAAVPASGAAGALGQPLGRGE